MSAVPPSSATAAPAASPAPPSMILVLGALASFAPLSIDMYLPAFPAIAADLGVSPGQVQFTLAAYFLGMALGQAFYGPLTDRHGRKRPLYAGLALYTLASIGCALAGDIGTLTALRLLQALGGCVCIVVPMAMVRDRCEPQVSARVLSRLALVMGLAPMLAPLVGAAMLGAAGWRSVFWLLAACGVAGLAASVLALPESLPAERRRGASPPEETPGSPEFPRPARGPGRAQPGAGGAAGALRTYGGLLADRHYLGFALASACCMGGMFAYIAASPFVLIDLHGLSPHAYSLVFGANALGLVAASQINHRLLRKKRSDAVLGGALRISATAGLAVLGVALASAAWPPLALPGTLVSLFVFVSMLGFVNPNAAAGALAHQGHQAGSASALFGTLQFTLASACGAAVGGLNDGSARPMGLAMAAAGLLAWLAYRTLARPGR